MSLIDDTAVTDVGTRVEDVRVPKRIDWPGRADLAIGVARVQRQKVTVEQFHFFAEFWSPGTLFHQLSLEHHEVKLADALESAKERRVGRDHRLCSFE